MAIQIATASPVERAVELVEWCSFSEITSERLCEALRSVRSGKRSTLWSRDELIFLGKVGPIAIEEINAKCGTKFEFDHSALPPQAVALAESLFYSMDNSVFVGSADVTWLRSKVRGVNHARRGLSQPDLLTEEYVTNKTIIEGVFRIKCAAMAIMVEQSTPHAVAYPPRAELLPEHERCLRDLFGTDLVAAFVYGSSVTGGGKDVDLIVVLNSLELDMYARMWSVAPAYRFVKPLGLTICPSAALCCAARFDRSGVGTGTAVKQVLGDPLALPYLTEAETISNDLLKAAKSLVSLRGPFEKQGQMERFLTAPKLLDAMLKLELWIGKALEQVRQQRMISKADAVQCTSFPWDGVPLPNSMPAVETAMIEANVRTAQRISRFVAEWADLPRGSL